MRALLMILLSLEASGSSAEKMLGNPLPIPADTPMNIEQPIFVGRCLILMTPVSSDTWEIEATLYQNETSMIAIMADSLETRERLAYLNIPFLLISNQSAIKATIQKDLLQKLHPKFMIKLSNQ